MVRKLSSPQHENKLSDSAKMDVLLSPYIIGAQCSTGADKDLNLTANDLINSYSPQARPLIQFDSDLAQTATRPQRNSTDYVTDGVDGNDSANRERAVIDTTDSIVNSIRCVNNLNETRQSANTIPPRMENNDYTVAERADSTVQAHLTADKWNDRHYATAHGRRTGA